MQSVTNFPPPLIIYFPPISYIAGSFYASQWVLPACSYGHLFPTPHPMVILINEHGTAHQGKSTPRNLKGKINCKNWFTMLLKSSIHRLRDAELQEATQLAQSHCPPVAIPGRWSMPLEVYPKGWISEAPKYLIKGDSKYKTPLTRNLRRVPSWSCNLYSEISTNSSRYHNSKLLNCSFHWNDAMYKWSRR